MAGVKPIFQKALLVLTVPVLLSTSLQAFYLFSVTAFQPFCTTAKYKHMANEPFQVGGDAVCHEGCGCSAPCPLQEYCLHTAVTVFHTEFCALQTGNTVKGMARNSSGSG